MNCKRCGSPELWREGLTNPNTNETKYLLELKDDAGDIGLIRKYHRAFCADCGTEFYIHPDKGMIEQ